MADDTTLQAAPPTPDSIPIDTEPQLPQVPIDLNPEYDPAKDQRAPFLKVNPNSTGPTISPAPDRSVGQVIKEAVTENIPQFSSRTSANPKFGKQSFLPDSDIMTAQQRREAPALAGGLDVASELASPATVATVAATAGLGEAGVIPKVLSGLFAGQIAKSVYDQYPALKAAVDKAQHAKSKEDHDDAFAEAQQLLTHMGADTVMGLLAAKHGAEGAKELLDKTTGSGVPDQASTFKAPAVEPDAPKPPAPEDVHPEYNRQTVKELQKLGYSSQHITQFNITEIRDILKNQTPASEYKFPQDNRQWTPNQPAGAPEAPKPAPEPDKFAAQGGKLVGPNPPEAVEKPVEAGEKPSETTDPVEDLIMSDKIGGKKVRGATPKAKPAEPVEVDGQEVVNHLMKTGKMDENDAMGRTRTYGAGKYALVDVPIQPSPITLPDGTVENEETIAGHVQAGDDYNPDLAKKYAAKKTPLPAIVLGPDGEVVDGNHRIAAAEIRGEKTIKAYVPRGYEATEAIITPQPESKVDLTEAFAEAGGKLVGKVPAPAAPAYHPDLQKVADMYGVHQDPVKAAEVGHATFIAPDGKYITMPAGIDHDKAIGKAVPERPSSATGITGGSADNRPGFMHDTDTIRVRPTTDRGGPTLHVETSTKGVTPEQVESLKRLVGQGLGRNGNMLLETTATGEDAASRYKEFVTPSHVDDMLHDIGVHPDQQDLLTNELQSPLKEKYAVEITDADGTTHTEHIDAFSPKNAIAVAQKKFPGTRAYSWRIEKMGEREPSTEYSVPTGKLAKMKESAGRPVVHTIRHELGHALVGQNEGLVTGGMLSSSHPDVGRSARAAVLWPGRDNALWSAPGRIRPDKVGPIVRTMMGGIAADELLNDVPRAANHNFDLRRGGDGTAAYKILRAAELNHDDAMEFLHQSIDDNKEYLAQPAVSGIISENENAREAGLSRQFHYSPERLQNMRTEVQRRIANAKNQPDTGINDNGTTGGGSAEVNSEDVARGEGGSPQATGAGVQEGKIANVETKEDRAEEDAARVAEMMKLKKEAMKKGLSSLNKPGKK